MSVFAAFALVEYEIVEVGLLACECGLLEGMQAGRVGWWRVCSVVVRLRYFYTLLCYSLLPSCSCLPSFFLLCSTFALFSTLLLSTSYFLKLRNLV